MKKERMRISLIIAALALLALTALSASAQTNGSTSRATNGPTNGSLDAVESDRIIHRFTAKEAEFRPPVNHFLFKRDALIQSIGMGGQVIGEYHRVSTFTFDDQGNRYEKISFFPMSSMPEVTAEDIEDLGGIEPFALEPSKIPLYNIR